MRADTGMTKRMPTKIIVCPGQGAQRPRMLTPWLKDPVAAGRLEEWSHRAGIDLMRLGTTASMEEISRTENTQPLLVAQALLVLDEVDRRTIAVAGHSVGELAAAAMAGVLEPGEAVHLARLRGVAMAEACGTAATTMAAVLGGDPEEVTAAIEAAGAVVANNNGSGQLVAAGPRRAVEQLADCPPTGTTVKPLPVAGAFHSPFMRPALVSFDWATKRAEFTQARVPVIQNLDGRIVRGGERFRERLVRQIAAPVRWDLCLRTMGVLAPELVVAAPPGRTLSAIVRRRLPTVAVTCITTPRDLRRRA